MEIDHPLVTLRQLSNLILKAPKQEQGSEQSCPVISILGVVTDASNWIGSMQKITVIDYTSQQSQLDVILQGSKREDFANELSVGDIIYLQSFFVVAHDGRMIAQRLENGSRFSVFSSLEEQPGQESAQTYAQSLNDRATYLDNQIRTLRRFSFDYFSRNEVPIKKRGSFDNLNPESEEKKMDKFFDLIALVTECRQAGRQFQVIIRNQNHDFLMNFSRNISPGVYKIRGITEISQKKGYVELKADLFTNFLPIKHWMSSYLLKKLSKSEERSLLKSRDTMIRTQFLRDTSDLEKLTLRQLLQKTGHFTDVVVRCQILDIVTPLQQVFKKIRWVVKDSKKKVEELPISQKEGNLITGVRLLITDPSMKGNPMNVYVCTYDGRGSEFIPGLNPEQIRKRLFTDKVLIKQRYQNFVNSVLQRTSYEQCPLELILSPMSRRARSEKAYRIVQTRLII